MNFGGVSLFSIVCEALWPEGFYRCMGMVLGLAAASILVLIVDIWWGALLGLPVGAMLIRYRYRRCRRSLGAVDQTGASMRFDVGPRHDTLTHRAGPIQMVDRFQARDSSGKEAQLVRAEILWHRHGDRHGARGHCLDLIGKMRPDDPLLAQTCNLYLSTCIRSHAKPVRPAVPPPAAIPKSLHPLPVTAGEAQIIPFKPRSGRPSTL